VKINSTVNKRLINLLNNYLTQVFDMPKYSESKKKSLKMSHPMVKIA
jgi:hypothetical protein